MLRKTHRIAVLAVFILLGWATGFSHAGETSAVVPSFERFHAKGTDPVLAGRLLLSELSCINCHAPDAAMGSHLTQRQAPILDGIGQRVQRDYLRKFISDPQAVKPGTTMPRVVPEQDKEAAVEALVHFLSTTGTLPNEPFDRKSIGAGKELYATVGCVVCHGPRDSLGEPAKVSVPKERDDDVKSPPSVFVPLGELKAKYSLTSLRSFLADPLHSRPSARMPALLDAKQAREVANYLLQGLAVGTFNTNVKYAYYEGSFAKVPNFKKMNSKASGEAYGLDVSLALRGSDFAMSFDGYLKVERDGDYHFHLSSDDGSNLFIDDKLVVNHDGVHAPSSKSGTAKLKAGMHKFHTGFFQAGGGFELSLDIDGPGLPRQSIAPFLFLTPEGNPKKLAKDEKKDNFSFQPELAVKGKELFTFLGCASCHQMTVDKKPLVSTAKYTALAQLPGLGGCLDNPAKKASPRYSLSKDQRTALTATLSFISSFNRLDKDIMELEARLKGIKDADEVKIAILRLQDKRVQRSQLQQLLEGAATPKARIVQTLTAFNCYACHQRDKVGGVADDLNPFMTGTQQDLADEGRLPPSLNGVGAKLNVGYLKDILDKGSHDRTYMNTRMPRFGDANVGHLVALFTALDKLEPVAEVEYKQPLAKVKAEGRHMVGALGLGCIKCHTFAGNKAEGVQGMDMTIMTTRLKRDWFHQYVLNPSKFRPGTRMPTAWPDGVSLLPKVLGGSTPQQIEAVWSYLSDAKKALVPLGMNSQFILLSPDKEAIIFRNFLAGSGPRSIAVGYPERAHLSFDANDLRIATLWQGAFMNAGRHWTNRGEGFEPPLGDNVLQLPNGVSFAVLTKDTDPWPTKSAREMGVYHFLGYRLTKDQRPTFMYTVGDVRVEDFPNPVRDKVNVSMVRTLTLTAEKAPDNLYFRAAVANKIEAIGDGWYRVGEWKMRIQSDAAPKIRAGANAVELLVPVQFKDSRATMVQEIAW